MSLKLGDTVPDFTQDSTEGPLQFHDWAGDGWVVLFSHPKDYTPVCTTELGTVLNFPLIADHDRKVSDLLDLIHPKASDTTTVRTVLVIDPAKKLRLTLTYPASTGRNFAEILRTIDSLQLTDSHKVATPADWRNGDDVIIVPSLDDKAAEALFPQGWTAQKPYLRLVRQPEAAR